MSSMSEEFLGSLIDEHVRYLRGEGPQPDLSALDAADRAHAEGVLDLVESLADSLPASPELEDDPVALRLGLIDAGDGSQEVETDPILSAVRELANRFGEALELEDGVAKAGDVEGYRFVLTCHSLAESVVVVAGDLQAEAPAARDARAIFANRPELSAVAFTSDDAAEAAVVTYPEARERLIPGQGWVAPGELVWEPLQMALGRYFERSLPQWDEVATLRSTDVVADLDAEAHDVAASKLNDVAETGPRLAHKREARQFVIGLTPDQFVRWVEAVRERRLSGDELASEVSDLCQAGTT